MNKLFVGIFVTVLGITALISGTTAWTATGPMNRKQYACFIIACVSGSICVGLMIATAIMGVQ